MIHLLLQRKADPGEGVFLDTFLLFRDSHLTAAGPCSVGPNPYVPSTGKPWYTKYGCIADGDYPLKVMIHRKYGKCLFVGNAKSLNPNPTHGGEYKITEVFVHRAYSDEWPGSRACPTMRSAWWEAFKTIITAGEEGLLVVRTYPGVTVEVADEKG